MDAQFFERGREVLDFRDRRPLAGLANRFLCFVPQSFCFFGVEATDPAPEDLAGLLAGPGQVVRMGGTARVSVVVDAAWRVHVLVAELNRRGLDATWSSTEVEGHMGVRILSLAG